MTGTNKKLNFDVIKTIKITKKQHNNWNPKNIRDFLDNKREFSFNEQINNIQQPLYDMTNGDKVINKISNICKDAVSYMNIMKLDTYSQGVKNLAIEKMISLKRFLDDQLRETHRVIDVQME